MPLFLIDAQQKPESWARLIANPENRATLSREGGHLHGGRSVGYWYGLTPGHIISIIEAEDELAAATLLCAQFGSGAFQHLRTTVLLTPEQMLDVMDRAKTFPYTPPGGYPSGPLWTQQS